METSERARTNYSGLSRLARFALGTLMLVGGAAAFDKHEVKDADNSFCYVDLTIIPGVETGSYIDEVDIASLAVSGIGAAQMYKGLRGKSILLK